jgi:hypothetical protein
MNTWHIDDELLRRYQAGSTDLPLAGSVEAHLIACATCRRRVANTVATERREKIWQNIEASIDRSQPGILPRMLARVRFPALAPPSATAVTSLRNSWWQATSAMICAILFLAVVDSAQGPTNNRARSPQSDTWGMEAPSFIVSPRPFPGMPMSPNSARAAVSESFQTVAAADLPALARSLTTWPYNTSHYVASGDHPVACRLVAINQNTPPLAITTVLYQLEATEVVPAIIVVFTNPNGPGRLDVYLLKGPCTGQPLAIREDIPRTAGADDQVKALM